MSLREKTRLLSRVDVLEPLSPGSLERFAARTPTLHLGLDRLFHTPARRGGTFLLLLEGRVRIYKEVSGREFTLGIVDAGALSGEGALTAQQLQGVYARAVEPSTAALVPEARLRALIAEEPEVGMRMIQALSDRLSVYGERLADLGRKAVKPRLASLVLQLVQSEGVVGPQEYRIPTRYTHEELAAMIGAGRVAVTRALAGLREGGCLDLRDRYIHVTDITALERAAKES